MSKKSLFPALFFLFSFAPILAQQKIENLIIVTTDGLRWQEVFKGLDSSLANNKDYNERDSAFIYKNYSGSTAQESRAKLMPFLWGTIAQQGQLYGNRVLGNDVNVANPYWFSYPGYNEIFTGFPDTAINSNDYPKNPNINVLEFIQQQPAYKNKVAAFAAWSAIDRILNKERCGFPVAAAFDRYGGNNPSEKEKLLNTMLDDSFKPWNDDESLDVFTHYAAMEYLTTQNPKVLYISYGETDDWAHAGLYRSYLNSAHQVDAWLKDLWAYVQNKPRYRNKTALLITVDHGRGENKQWTSHGKKIKGSDQIWFGIIGPGIASKGEVKQKGQLYQKQLAQTVAALLGMKFEANHPVANKIEGIWK